MNITYRDADLASKEDCTLLARWYNDPEIKHLYSLFPDEGSFSRDFTPDDFHRMGQRPTTHGPSPNLLILADGVPIGQATLEPDTPKLLTKTKHTAWLALVIGEGRMRRCGLGTRVTADLEALAVEMGIERVEIGVFEYNTRALRFFTGLGYTEFERSPGRVWWDGTMWSEIRLLKTL